MATSNSSNDDLLKSIFQMVETKGEQKKERKKRVMTAEQKAKAIQNLASGRAKSLETRRRKKAEKEGGIVPSKPAPSPKPPSPTPPPEPVSKPEPAPVSKPEPVTSHPKPTPVQAPAPTPIAAPIPVKAPTPTPIAAKAGAYTNLHELLVNLHVYWVLASLHPTYIQLTCCSEYRMITYCIMIIY
jgi:hypothetical protein